jgi:hypothetical protein
VPEIERKGKFIQAIDPPAPLDSGDLLFLLARHKEPMSYAKSMG